MQLDFLPEYKKKWSYLENNKSNKSDICILKGASQMYQLHAESS